MNIDNELRERLKNIYIQKAMMQGSSVGMVGHGMVGGKFTAASLKKAQATRRKNALLKKRCALKGMGYSVGGIAKGKHMTAQAKKKAATTRAKNLKLACMGLKKKRKARKVKGKGFDEEMMYDIGSGLENHMMRSESAKCAAKHNPWIKTVKRVARENKGLDFADIIHLAQAEYHR